MGFVVLIWVYLKFVHIKCCLGLTKYIVLGIGVGVVVVGFEYK